MAEAKGVEQKKAEIVRCLGAGETIYAHMVAKFRVSILFQVGVVDSSQPLSPEDVKEAGRILASRQMALRMRIVQTEPNNDLQFSFATMDNWDDIQVRLANLDSKNDWVNIINEEYNRAFDYENGLWGIILATVGKNEQTDGTFSYRYVIILKMHHAISDAKSAFDVMYRQYLPILSAVINKEDPLSILKEDIPLVASCEESFDNPRLPWYLSGGLTAYRWFNRTFRKPIEPYIYEYKEDPERTKEEKLSDPGFLPFVFSSELTQGILNAAKSHGVTVHCVVLGVTSAALSATCGDAGVKLSKELSQGWIIDTRKFLGWQFPQPLGAYTGNGMTTTKNKSDYTEVEFWNMCKKISKGVKSGGSKEKCVPTMGFAEYCINHFPKTGTGFDMLQEFHMTSCGNVSNLGNCDVGPEPKMMAGNVTIKLMETYFAVTGLRAWNGMAFFHSLSTFQGQMMWNLTYNPNEVSKRFAQNYMLKIQEVFERFCLPEKEEHEKE